MHPIKSLILCSVIVVLNAAEAEFQGNDISPGLPTKLPATPIPIVLLMTTQQSVNHQSSQITPIKLQSSAESNEIKDESDFKSLTGIDQNENEKQHKSPNDVEVFEHKSEPANEKQEEVVVENTAKGEKEGAVPATVPQQESEPEDSKQHKSPNDVEVFEHKPSPAKENKEAAENTAEDVKKATEQESDMEFDKSQQHKSPNDVEVFEHKPSPAKENQEAAENAAEDVKKATEQESDMEFDKSQQHKSPNDFEVFEHKPSPAKENQEDVVVENTAEGEKEAVDREQHASPNDIEVFEQKPGPVKANQEEEAEENAVEDEEAAANAEPEEAAEPEVELEQEVEAEAEKESDPEPEQAAEPEVVAEPDPAPEEESEPETAAEPAPAPEPESEPEPEAEHEEKPEPEVEPETPAESNNDEKPQVDAAEETMQEESAKQPQAENAGEPQPQDEYMQNDKPADDDEHKEPTTIPATNSDDKKDNHPNTCYSCNSQEEIKCKTKPEEQVHCKSVDSGSHGGHGGCYTIFKVDANMTMRGCVEELAEQGLRDCLSDDKFCNLCYSNGCNNKLPPNAGVKPQLAVSLLVLINGIAYGLMKYL